jgi:hypothetical protein
MSKIEVNTIDTQCGSALQIGCTNTATIGLGKSGDTITIPSGATIVNSGTQTGFGREGSVDWQTGSIKTGTFTAVTGEGYFVNTSGGTATVNLPAGAAGSIVAIADYTRTFNSNNCTVAPNGSEKIGGVAQDGKLTVNGQSATFVYVDGTEGWINVQETQTSQTGTPPFVIATGGTPCAGETSGDYRYHTFTGPGTFCVSSVSPSAPENVVSYMVVAGGGGGGKTINPAPGGGGGGGGAGGFREYKNSCDPYTASPLNGNPCGTAITVTATAYPIDIGGGATPVASPPIANGGPSTFSTIVSAGGGTGGIINPNQSGTPGGSGGGGPADNATCAGTGNSPPTTPAQGTNGGLGQNGGYGGGGGGGATVAGGAGPGTPGGGGTGGNGATTSINGTPTARAGGGGGGGYSGVPTPAGGSAGTGGGGIGAGTACAATAGQINTGGGGGGGSSSPTLAEAGGGSGIVIIRYKFQ